MAGLRFLPGKTLSATLVMWAVSIAHIMAADTDIVINEIMYHPPLDMEELQYVELFNRGTAPVDLSKWTFARGIKFTFPDKTLIAPGGFLVVCRQLDVFTANYGKVPVVGSFTGKISHRGEKIELHNAAGAVVDGLKFSDQAPWPMGPDGYSASLERISPSGPSEDPANWAGSALPKSQKPAGTPGRKNDNFAAVMPPGIANVRISASAPMQPTTVTADVEDPQGIKGVSILCHYARSGGETPDKEAQMQRISGDEKKGTYQATIEGVAAGKLVRMRVKAQSTSGAVRMSPGPNEPRKTYSFSTFVNTNNARVPFAYVMTISEPQADARVKVYNPKAVEVASATTTGNAAFIFAPPDGGPIQTFDHVQVRPRKGGFKVHFLKDQTFKGMSGINLIFENSARWLLSEPMAYELYRAADVPAPLTDHFRVWMDGRPIGYQLMIEQPNKSFLSRNKRNDSGNLYKVLWFEDGLIRQHAKRTRATGSHQDLVDLHKNLTSTSGQAQWEFIEKHFNVEEFTGYYAVNMCIQNWDGFFNNYYLYHDLGDTGKWEMYPWDEDKTWGDFDGAPQNYTWYTMPLSFGANNRGHESFGGGGGWERPPGWFSGPLLANPEFRRRFLARLSDICEHEFTQEKMVPLIDAMEKRLQPEMLARAEATGENGQALLAALKSDIQSLRNQVKYRREFILKAIPKERASR